MSVCPSVHPQRNNSAPAGWIFMKFDTWFFFSKSVEKIQVSLKSDKNNGHFTWRPMCVHLWKCGDIAQFLLEWEMFRRRVVEKIKTHILCSVTFLRKSCRLWDNLDKYCTDGQATDDNMAHAYCVPDT
jgi:hypothetical protein